MSRCARLPSCPANTGNEKRAFRPDVVCFKRCCMVAGEGIEPPTRGFSILATAHRIVTGIYCYPLQTSQLTGNLSPLLRVCTDTPATPRSEERRVGKEVVSKCRSRWSHYH